MIYTFKTWMGGSTCLNVGSSAMQAGRFTALVDYKPLICGFIIGKHWYDVNERHTDMKALHDPFCAMKSDCFLYKNSRKFGEIPWCLEK